ncbi:patatin-like phospholipase family protein [Paracidovorax sp. MALMAid1276]|uniref:patatin-like phospholipase family protein n=1 Tax=Paracidovorax sp. MALMAid1276 TaxID=3411631 RepID=UPI003B99946F
MRLTAAQFHAEAAPAVAQMRAEGLDRKAYSDALDAAGRQYVDLVMEGGGVLGIALVGYLYLLEQAGLRFSALGGASAGSITALVLAALGEPSEPKCGRLVEIVANIPMAEFMDGKDDDDDDARDFINTLLRRPGLARGVWKGVQVVDNLRTMQGLNRGDRFQAWLTRVLADCGISTTRALRQRMAATPLDWHLRPGSLHAASQLQGAPALPPLDAGKDYLCIVAADIATETKVEFPRMAGLYWADPDAVNPADYARCSMSIPLFFRPYRVPMQLRDAEHRKLWCQLAGMDERDMDPGRVPPFPPPEACFIDGGVLSNFPIDAFHNTLKVPTRPTLGVKLQWDDRSHTIASLTKVVTQTFNASRHCLDYEFLRKNPDFKQLVAYIDTADHDWLDFEMSDEGKLDLFRRGAEAARAFLAGFDWEGYKKTREHLVGAYAQAWGGR